MVRENPIQGSIFSLIPSNSRTELSVKNLKTIHLFSKLSDVQDEDEITGINVGPKTSRSDSRHVLAKIGRHSTENDIVFDEVFVSRQHCSFVVNPETPRIELHNHLRLRNTHVFIDSEIQPFDQNGTVAFMPHEKMQLRFGPPNDDGPNSFIFDVFWHRTSFDWTLLEEREDTFDITRDKNFELVPTTISLAPTRMVTRVHSRRTPGGQTHMKYQTLRRIGNGSFGTVFAVLDLFTKQTYACKKVLLPKLRHLGSSSSRGKTPEQLLREDQDAERTFLLLKREIELPIEFEHPNILKYRFAQRADHSGVACFEIFMDLKEGSVETLAEQNLFSKSLPLGRAFMHQMLQALDYLASQNLVHRDLKPANILFNRVGRHAFNFQLADFGLMAPITDSRDAVGTREYAAPELHAGPVSHEGNKTTKLDIWSLFMTYASIIDAKAPNGASFRAEYWNGEEFDYDKICNGAYIALLDKRCREFQRMADPNPETRASAAEMIDLNFAGMGRAQSSTRSKTLAVKKIKQKQAGAFAVQKVSMIEVSA